jgi:hypothetical protein
MHAGRQSLQFLVHDGGRSFDEHARLLFSLAVQLVENRVEALAALNFERHGGAGGEPAQMPDDFIPVCQSVLADGLADERLQDLLGAPPSDAKGKFGSGSI